MNNILQILDEWDASRDLNGAKRFVQALVLEIGPGFHPETRSMDYVSTSSDGGAPLFEAETAKRLDVAIAHAARILNVNSIDICDVALPVQRALLHDYRG